MNNPYTNNSFQSADLKTILHSKRANIYYLQHCRVMQKDGRVLYLTESEKENLYYNIPIANTTSILLGTGTSITQAAMRMLSQAGVLVGFCGGGGTPLFMGTEIEWFTPQSEYRPTEYIQGWLSWWWDEDKRLQMAKKLQTARLDFMKDVWARDKDLRAFGFDSKSENMANLQQTYRTQISQQKNVTDLLTLEGRMTKDLYKIAAANTNNTGFSREHDGVDKANAFLNHGNYLAYGLGATTAWVLGIPHGFAVMHGKTRRGALVFDIADIVKDTIVLPLAFICANDNATEQEFRQECLNYFTTYHALDVMFDSVKALALNQIWEN
ncbi:type I-F CRISPR-associated endonuclease Cas1f [Kingella negevensis]|uniref:type I-F CRISPR-associated endonuclease Cas1f n=1 Tax=Kingella negevensis TaxID=1522312 RepID=UPI002542F32F|nr:type I-F CRISPR-associated endonuclease Cas1f [Kingella negevensis]MDK4681169.1 type I-F CRISPR-associated endonuclease Cas1f [Kingella negevensis]MDK4683370.1 type I-F CRISPR-associated endonuclease Cas1f [Kingella negevensis]MDK4691498.1 type I-F CRISPR-associated endonuclease Cas1f [Kingella negevensis]MDK4693351.1 type I-F CRISPR-associated endonuclease Cas1f [Kingella negevensis]MDK4699651.1 type I-F CRISPR-associated endonuclease Cas1f [Kingella negevensis]